MSIAQKSTCVSCGGGFTYQTQNHGRPRLYCSVECRRAKSNRGSITSVVKCHNCGKNFTRLGKSKRGCCSRTCAIADVRRQAVHYRDKEPACGAFRDWVVSLCLNGYGYEATSEALGLSRWTVQSWVARSKGRKSRHKSRRYFGYPDAQSADEWVEKLRTEVTLPTCGLEPISMDRPVFIVCGTVDAKKGIDQLSAIVAGRLRMNPFDGSVYVFCGCNHESIRYMFWDGAEFCVVARRRERGTYLWPSPQLGAVMALTPQDFELILLGRGKSYDNRSLDWDSLNISGTENTELSK